MNNLDIRQPFLRAALILVLLAGLSGCATQSLPPITSISAQAAKKIGVVCLHGKLRSPFQMSGIEGYLRQIGFLVSSPELSWSGDRSYDKTLEESAAEVTAAIEALRKQGATKVVLVGQSLGSVFAAYYMGRYPVDAVVGISPGHTPGSRRYIWAVSDSVDKAREMVRRGAGKEKAWFVDLQSGGREGSVRTTAEIYLEFNAPDSPLAQDNLVAKLNTNIPMLILANMTEVGNANGRLSDELASQSPAGSYKLLEGTHGSLVNGAAQAEAAKWIISLYPD